LTIGSIDSDEPEPGQLVIEALDMADNDENPDRALLETAIIVMAVLGAAAALSLGWRMVSPSLSHPTHAARHEGVATTTEVPPGATQHANPSDGT
jgi:hypothetical protein